jgi:hypothetical protein
VLPKGDVEIATPDDYRLRGVVVPVPAAGDVALDPDKADVHSANDGLMFAFPFGSQPLENRPDVNNVVHCRSFLARIGAHSPAAPVIMPGLTSDRVTWLGRNLNQVRINDDRQADFQ